MYQAEWINNGKFIIKDIDYGHILCRLEFSNEMIEQLTPDHMQKIANEVKDLIIIRLNLEDKKGHDTSL